MPPIVRLLLPALATVAVLLPVSARADDLADLEAKAQYAFFTGDLNAARAVAKSAAALGRSQQPLELYHHAHAQFRLLQVALGRQQRREAEAAGEACVASLDRALRAEPQSAEALALQGACHGYLASFGALRGMTAGPRSGSRLEAARKLAPNNPRVLLAEAFGLYFRPAAFGGDPVRAGSMFVRAAQAFDAVQEPRHGQPTWGAAEAWLFAGRHYEEQGDVLAARNAYEKALIVAPDFAAARARLARLSAGR